MNFKNKEQEKIKTYIDGIEQKEEPKEEPKENINLKVPEPEIFQRKDKKEKHEIVVLPNVPIVILLKIDENGNITVAKV